MAGRPVDGYRARHDAGLALYHHWLAGRFIAAGRRGIERPYDLFERVAPAEFQYEPGEDETEAAMARAVARRVALATPQAWRDGFRYAIHRPVPPAEAAARLAGLEAEGLVARVRVEGSKGEPLVPLEELALLAEV